MTAALLKTDEQQEVPVIFYSCTLDKNAVAERGEGSPGSQKEGW